MSRSLSLAAAALLLTIAGCAGADDAAVDPTAAAAEAPAIEWETAWQDGVVRVRIVDPRGHYRVESVELIAPSGRTLPTAELTREVVRDEGYAGGVRPSVGVGTGYSSHGGFGAGVGVGVLFPIGGGGEPRRTETVARIPVPDAEEYRRSAAQWLIRATLREPSGEPRYAHIPAPVPGT